MHTGNSRANSREDLAAGGAQGEGQLQAGTWSASMPAMVKREPHPERGSGGVHNSSGGKGRNKRPLLKVRYCFKVQNGYGGFTHRTDVVQLSVAQPDCADFRNLKSLD